jgi:hypothetical protein
MLEVEGSSLWCLNKGLQFVMFLLQQIYLDKEKNYILDFMSQSPLKQIFIFCSRFVMDLRSNNGLQYVMLEVEGSSLWCLNKGLQFVMFE